MSVNKNELLILEDAVCKDLRENIAELKHVEVFPGQFDEKTLQEYSFDVPAAFLSWRGFTRSMNRNSAGQFIGPATFSILLLVHDEAGLSPRQYMKIILHRLIERIELQQWGLPFVNPAQITSAEPIHSPVFEDNGVTCAAITFEQEIVFGRNIWAEETAKALGSDMESIKRMILGGPHEDFEIDDETIPRNPE